METVYLASDHAGLALKNAIAEHLRASGYDIEDFGAHEYDESDDYPDFMLPLARRVASTPGARGIVLGGSGQGEAMACNRLRGIRAAVFYGGDRGINILRLSREHNDANILSIGARFVTQEEAIEVVSLWLQTPFSGDERHVRRIAKLDYE